MAIKVIPKFVSGDRKLQQEGAFSIESLDYALPEELIAQHPPPRREDARLLILDRATGALEDRSIRDFPSYLRPGDLLVLNDTKVLPARFMALRSSGGRVSALFLEEEAVGRWQVLLRESKRLRVGEALSLVSCSQGPSEAQFHMELKEKGPNGQWSVAVSPPHPAEEILQRIGFTPLPPYISRTTKEVERWGAEDQSRYQTVYAREPGSVAAPTAGLHLTESMLADIRANRVEIASITLHVGLGTFRPISADTLSDHVMHEEHFVLPEETARAVSACRRQGGRVVAVGTTTVRALETVANLTDRAEEMQAYRGKTNLFICPPYHFRVVDALLTNFHLPRSTLLALVMAFGGVEEVRKAYEHAVASRYRFYSFGDAMFVQGGSTRG